MRRCMNWFAIASVTLTLILAMPLLAQPPAKLPAAPKGFDKKRDKVTGIKPSPTVIWIRPRGLHIHQGGIFQNDLTSASLFDVASIVRPTHEMPKSTPRSFNA